MRDQVHIPVHKDHISDYTGNIQPRTPPPPTHPPTPQKKKKKKKERKKKVSDTLTQAVRGGAYLQTGSCAFGGCPNLQNSPRVHITIISNIHPHGVRSMKLVPTSVSALCAGQRTGLSGQLPATVAEIIMMTFPDRPGFVRLV